MFSMLLKLESKHNLDVRTAPSNKKTGKIQPLILFASFVTVAQCIFIDFFFNLIS